MQKARQIIKSTLIVVCFSIFILTSTGTGFAEPINDPEDANTSGTGIKVASGALTLFYLPVKATYAGLGGIVGGIAYVFGGEDKETAQAVWIPTMKGTYFITPEHIRGDKPIQFFGKAEPDIPRNAPSRESKQKKS